MLKNALLPLQTGNLATRMRNELRKLMSEPNTCLHGGLNKSCPVCGTECGLAEKSHVYGIDELLNRVREALESGVQTVWCCCLFCGAVACSVVLGKINHGKTNAINLALAAKWQLSKLSLRGDLLWRRHNAQLLLCTLLESTILEMDTLPI